MAERLIPVEWVELAVAEPALRTPDPNDPDVERFFRSIPECGNRALRVAVNTRVVPWRVVSAFFDRSGFAQKVAFAQKVGILHKKPIFNFK